MRGLQDGSKINKLKIKIKCGFFFQTTVVESNEWVPIERFPMTYDNITDAWISVIFAKIPSSALPTHGVLIRLMSAIPELQVITT